jgi:hypothetical protein
MEDTALTVSGSRASLAPTVVTSAKGEKAVVDAAWNTDSDAFEFGLTTEGMTVDSLRPFLAGTKVPLLNQVSGGNWSGTVRTGGASAGWTGDLRITDSSVRVEAFAEPVHISQAEAVLSAAGTTVRKLSLNVGGLEAQGDYSYDAAAKVPHVLHLAAAQVDCAAVEKLLKPTLNRAGLLNKTLNLGKVPSPEWLHNLRAGGTLQIGTLTLGSLTLTRVRTRLEWNGETVVFPGLTAQAGGASLNGVLTADLVGAEPRYEFSGRAGGISWRGGSLEAEGVVTTAGSGEDLLESLTAKGAFTARGLDLTPLSQFSSAQGQFDLKWPRGGPRLSLEPLSATAGGVAWRGSVEPRDNGAVFLKLTAGEKELQATGAVFRGEPLVPAVVQR